MAATPNDVVVSIADMIDLAIGTPEIGVVDFIMLQTVLHCLAQQLRCSDKNVELRGPIAAIPVVRHPEQATTIAVDEFLMQVDGKPVQSPEDEDTILIAERILKSNRKPLPKKKTAVPAKPATGPSSAKGAEAAHSGAAIGTESVEGGSLGATSTEGLEGALRTPSALAQAGALAATQGGTPGETGGQRLSLVTLNKFNLLENTVADLKERVYGSIPKNEQILEEVRSQTNLKAITDMWTSLNVSSRLEAAETGLATLSALLQDLIVKSGGSKADGKSGTDLSSRLAAAEKNIQDLTSLLQNLIAQGLVSEAQLQTVLSKMYEALSTSTSGHPTDAHGQPEPGIGQPVSASGQAAADSGQPASASGQPASASGQPASASGQQASAFGQTAPGSGQAASAIGPVQAMMTAAKAMVPPTQVNLDCLKLCKEDLLRLEAIQIELGEGLEHLSNTFYDAMQKMNQKVAEPHRRISIAKSSAPSAHIGHTASTTTASTPSKGPSGKGHMDGSMGKRIMDNTEKIKDLENQLNILNKIVITPRGNLLEQLLSLQDRIDYYLREKAATDGGPPAHPSPMRHVPGPEAPSALAFSQPPSGMPQGITAGQNIPPAVMKDIQGLMSLFNTVESMQSQLQQVHETALQLAAESEDRQLNIDALLEQIELLKAIKLDREDMVEALADKADLRMLARKVSHDQFEMACDDLSRGLEQALGKFNLQETLWQQALDDIQREIETKLDKMELSPVKEFFNNKLKLLQDNLKKLAQLRREAEAAGTKKKLFTDVNCISCDAKAYMSPDPPPAVPPKPLPPTKSMKPYLSYELDAIRKAQSSALPQRNMHDWERIDKQMTSKQPHRVRSDTGKHICNRYCGGSHTTTTPAQRVARLGHFVKQWGPEVLPLSAGYATGDDGRQYKVSGTETANVGPGGAVDASCRSFAKKFELAKQGTSSIKHSGSLDCRCLEDIFPPSPKKERNK